MLMNRVVTSMIHTATTSCWPEFLSSGRVELPRTELAFADHPLVSVHIVLDAILRTIALSEEQTDDFVAAFGRLVDAPIGKEFHCLANAVFVF